MRRQQSENNGVLQAFVGVNPVCDAPFTGDPVLEQLREEKEFAEGQVRMSGP